MKKRIISAVIFVPLLVLILLLLPTWGTVLISTFLSVAAAYELIKNTNLVSCKRIRIYTYLAAGLVPIVSRMYQSLLGLQLLIFLFCILLFSEAMLSKSEISIMHIGVCLAAGILIPFIYSGLVRLSNYANGERLILIPFVIAFMSDAGAYFTGLAIGKHHFAQHVSTHKTVEGVIGGILWALIGMLLYVMIINKCCSFTHASYIKAALYGCVGSLAATFGDLCFSYIKRQVGIKDFGNLIPGHGGVLDRFDSMTMVMMMTEIFTVIIPILQ